MKKLHLSKETLATLSPEQADAVAGGGSGYLCGSSLCNSIFCKTLIACPSIALPCGSLVCGDPSPHPDLR